LSAFHRAALSRGPDYLRQFLRLKLASSDVRIDRGERFYIRIGEGSKIVGAAACDGHSLIDPA
jgi:hypothetical protein